MELDSEILENMSFEELAQKLFIAAQNFINNGNSHRAAFRMLHEELMRRYFDFHSLKIAKEIVANRFKIPQIH